jgi:hypothetical protein
MKPSSMMKPSGMLPSSSMKRSPFKLDRRAFLRGAGTAGLALPFLEGIPERSAFAAGASTPTFGFFLCTSCGVVGNKFWPGETGELTTAGLAADTTKAVSILADYADRLLMVSGVNYPGSAAGCSHADGLAKCLTASSTSGGSNNVMPSGISCDTVIAEGLGVTPLTLYAGLKGGYIEEKLSFSAPGKVRAAEGNPYNVYLDLAGLLDQSTGEPTPMVDQLVARRKSVNDLVRGDLQSLLANRRLSAADRQRLDLHLESIFDLENKMMDMGTMGGLGCTGSSLDMAALEAMNGGGGFGGAPYEANGSQEEVVKLQMELVALAFSCNVTRVATLQAGDGTDGTQYTINGEKYERFHHISHRVNSDNGSGSAIANAEGKHHNVDRLRLETFKYGLDKWAQYGTPNGPLLDNGFVYWTSHISDGPSHSFKNLPIIIAGSAGGYLKQGAYVDAGESSNARVLNTLITANGVPTENFGTGGTGVVDEMLA